jgi:hypothetical protein
MRHSRLACGLAALLAAVTVLSTPLRAQRVIDQLSHPPFFVGFPFQDYWIAQSFMTSAGNVSGAGFHLRNIHGDPSLPIESSTMTLNLWTALPSQAGATKLAGGTATVSATFGDFVWADVFWNPVGVLPGTTYWLTAGLSNPIFQALTYGDDQYPWGISAHSDHFHAVKTEFTSYEIVGDLVFRTYTTVPEPSTVWLVGAGLVGLAMARRRRSAAHVD